MKEKRQQNDWKSGEGKLELENKPDGEEKGTSGQKPTMTYAEFKAQKGRKRGRDRGPGINKDLAVKIAAVCGGVVVLVGAVGGGLYWHESLKYKTCFLPGTIVDGMDVTGKTAAEVEDAIMEQLKGYKLTINGREDLSESITGEEVGLYAEFDDTLAKAIAAQKPMEWGKYRFGKSVNEVNTDALIRYNDEMLGEAVDSLSCMDKENMREPQDAKISDYTSGGYTIIKEDEGTELLEDKVKEAVAAAVMSLAESVDLEEQGCYVSPSITSEDEALKTACETMNKYVGARITYQFGDKSETLSGDEIHNWLTVNGTSVRINEGKATEYVKKLAASYDTAYKAKSLKTSYGKTVSITGGSYGYKINQAKEAATLVSLIKNGEQTSREPEYSQKGASRTGNDYGNTYVEINLTAQHLYFYVKGKLVVQSDFVSGNAAKGWSTPAGAYPLTYKRLMGRKFVNMFLLIPMYFGGGMIPTFLLINKLGLYDNPLSQILPVCFSIWNIILVKAFFSSIPESLREAAKIDGANVYQILIKVYLPLSKPILAVIAVYTIVGVWNSWFNAMVYLPHPQWQPLQLYLRRVLIENTKQITEVLSPSAAQELARKQMSNAQLKYAMIIFTTLPVLFTYPFFQKYFVKGVMLGSLKE